MLKAAKNNRRLSRLVKSLDQANKNLETLYMKYMSSPPYIYYSYMEKVKVNTGVQLAEGVFSEKKVQACGSMTFEARLEPNATINVHVHDCLEYITPVQGSFIDLESGEMFGIGERINIEPWQTHAITNISDDIGILDVMFIKPKKNEEV